MSKPTVETLRFDINSNPTVVSSLSGVVLSVTFLSWCYVGVGDECNLRGVLSGAWQCLCIRLLLRMSQIAY